MCQPHYRAKKLTGDPHQRYRDRQCRKCWLAYTPATAGTNYCPPCSAYAASPEAKAVYNAEWHRRHPGYSTKSNGEWRARNPERYKAYYTQYRQDNLEAVRAAMAAWEARNPDHSKIWLRNNREAARLAVQRRRAKRAAAESFLVTERDRRRALDRSRGCCYYCDKKIAGGYVAWDHVLPLVAGGRNSIGNLVPCCRACNSKKSSFLLAEWRFKDRLSEQPCRRRYDFDAAAR